MAGLSQNGEPINWPALPRQKDHDMSGLLMNNGQHWRKCAEQARRHSGKFIAPEARRAVLDLADSYELLAQRADERAEEDKPPQEARRCETRTGPLV
jgi:hypothetical protein